MTTKSKDPAGKTECGDHSGVCVCVSARLRAQPSAARGRRRAAFTPSATVCGLGDACVFGEGGGETLSRLATFLAG